MDKVADIVGDILEKQEKKRKAKSIKKPKKVKKLTKRETQILEIANNTKLPDNYFTVWTKDDLEELCKWLSQQEYLAVDTETMGLNWLKDPIVGLSVYGNNPARGYYIPLAHQDDINTNKEAYHAYKNKFPDGGGRVGIDYVQCLPKSTVISYIAPHLEDKNKKLLFHNWKFDHHVLRHWLGINVDLYFDTVEAQALLDENQSKALKDMAGVYLKIPADTFSKLFGNVTFNKVPILLNPFTRTGNLAAYYAIKDTELTFKMFEFQIKHLNSPNLKDLKKLLFEISIPFARIVADAERRGIRVDKKYLEEEVAPKLHKELDELRQKIFAYTGELNLNSPAQLSPVLYEKLGLPKVNKKKPESTDKKTLKKLRKYHPVIPLILEYRSKSKLTSAFADKLPKDVINGRIHPSFNPSGAKTWRMSCSDPNLQQIPARVGGLIRNAFMAEKGRLLVSIDFSQQELRWLAHMSRDEVMLNAFKQGKDLHSITAVSLYNMSADTHVTYEEFEYKRGILDFFTDKDGEIDEGKLNNADYVSRLHNEGKINTTNVETLKQDLQQGKEFNLFRSRAKMVNFGIVYGISEVGLSDDLEISEEEATKYIKSFFKTYPGVARWVEKQKKEIREKKYTLTWGNKKRRLYPLVDGWLANKYANEWMLQKAYRQGINAIIQGSSAVQTKLVSIKLQPLLKELDVYIVLWVHDEIIFDAPMDIGMENLRRIADVMCNSIQLDCGMKSDIEVGERWMQRLTEDDIRELLEEAS